MNQRAIGTEYEKIAADYLKKKGHTILERNYRIRSGEIDLITKDGAYLVFTEVKYRGNDKMGMAQEAVSLKKQQKIIRTATHFLLSHGYGEDTPCRFDVLAITGNQIKHIEDAFEV